MKLTSLAKPFATAIAILSLSLSAQAQDSKVGDIVVSNPWIKATPKGAKVGGGYLTLKNMGKTADRLVSGTLSKAARTEIHEMSMKDGIMNMAQLPKGLPLKSGESAELKPGSYHMMFMGLKEQLKAGDKIKGTLVFEKAGSVAIEYTVKSMKHKMKHKMPAKEHRGSMSGH